MFDSLYKLLDLTPGTYSPEVAHRNYLSIIRAVHPDRNPHPDSVTVASAVVQAYDALSDPITRAYYNRHGRLSATRPYDNDLAEQNAVLMCRIINMYHFERSRRERERAAELERAARAAARSQREFESPTRPPVRARQENEQAAEAEHAARQVNRRPREAEEPTPGSSTQEGLGSSTRPILIDSDDDSSSEVEHEDRPPSYEECRYTSSSPRYFTTTKDASTSPIKTPAKTFVDASTSPIKWPTKVQVNASTSPLKSPSKTDCLGRSPSLGRRYISEVLSMRTRSEGGSRTIFKVKWGPSGDETTEPASVVIKEHDGLSRWLEKLRYREPRRFKAVIRHHPEFLICIN